MPDSNWINVLYVKNNKYIPTKLTNLTLIKKYKAKNDHGLMKVTLTRTDGVNIGQFHMTYDTFNHLFTKGHVACATICKD